MGRFCKIVRADLCHRLSVADKSEYFLTNCKILTFIVIWITALKKSFSVHSWNLGRIFFHHFYNICTLLVKILNSRHSYCIIKFALLYPDSWSALKQKNKQQCIVNIYYMAWVESRTFKYNFNKACFFFFEAVMQLCCFYVGLNRNILSIQTGLIN